MKTTRTSTSSRTAESLLLPSRFGWDFDVEVAYRKSVVRTFGGPELFAPVSDLDPLKAVINSVTTALGPPIAGLKSLKSQGTMCFSFRVSEDLYAVTTRHVLFPDDEGNDPYTYIGTFFSLSR